LAVIERTIEVEASANELYEVVSNIEQYPSFLTWCDSSEILSIEDNLVTASLCITILGFQSTITTLNQLDRPTKIEMNLQKGPFKSFKGIWLFEVIELERTRVTYSMEYRIVNPITEYMVKQKLTPFVDQFVGEFVKKFKEETTN
jgi:ribosome-associated toxin RatA of RatAB toxin-antitoxin module